MNKYSGFHSQASQRLKQEIELNWIESAMPAPLVHNACPTRHPDPPLSNVAGRTRAIARSVKCLPCQHEDLSSDSQDPPMLNSQEW